MPPEPRAAGVGSAAAVSELAASLSLAMSSGQAERLVAYLTLLQRWNATYNLTAVRDPAQMLTQHLADCLAVVAPLRRQLGATPKPRVLDVGSGGGLPGVVLAIMSPDLSVTCVDTVGKKAAFIRQAAGELGLRLLQSEHARVEALRAPPFDVIVSRAFASLADFTTLTGRHLRPDDVTGPTGSTGSGGVWMAMKGKRPNDEIAALAPDVAVFHVEPLAVPGLAAERCIVWMKPRT